MKRLVFSGGPEGGMPGLIELYSVFTRHGYLPAANSGGSFPDRFVKAGSEISVEESLGSDRTFSFSYVPGWEYGQMRDELAKRHRGWNLREG